MGTHTNRGFTIIELILVVGVTGLLTVMLLAGTGTAVNGQRYRDAVQTFRGTLQTQYSELASVRNGRPNNWNCSKTTAVITTTNPGVTEARGQSDCVLLGRLLTINKGEITTYSIVGTQITAPTDTTTDFTELTTNYRLNADSALTTTSQLEWGTEIAYAASGYDSNINREREMSILFITAPTSGQVYTFAKNGPIAAVSHTSLSAMINETSRERRVICIESKGLVLGEVMSVYLAPKASESSAVESRPNQLLDPLPGGGASQC